MVELSRPKIGAPQAPRIVGASAVEAFLGDLAIRQALKARLRSRYAGAAVLDELGLCRGRVRVDVAVVNGLLHGYEIKSDRDSLRRLPCQVEVFGRVLDRATLVVGLRHLDRALGLVPDWWEVQVVRASPQGAVFTTHRPGRRNPARDPRALVENLWLDQALSLLATRRATRGVRGKPRRIVWDRVCQVCSIHEIATAVRRHLRARATSPIPRRRR